MLLGFASVLASSAPVAKADTWASGDIAVLHWACPNIQGTQRAQAYFSRGPLTDREARGYLERSGCYVEEGGFIVRLDQPLLRQLTLADGRPATIWRVYVKTQMFYGLIADAEGPQVL